MGVRTAAGAFICMLSHPTGRLGESMPERASGRKQSRGKLAGVFGYEIKEVLVRWEFVRMRGHAGTVVCSVRC